MARSVAKELSSWLKRNGYAHAKARKLRQAPTGRVVFAAHEREGHITTSGRRALAQALFALPPTPKEQRRGIKGRLPIDTIERARSALARASMLHNQGDLSAVQLDAVRERVHRAWPSISSHGNAHATMKDDVGMTFEDRDEATHYGRYGHDMGHSLKQTLTEARSYYHCPERWIGDVEKGWNRARLEASHRMG